MRRADVQPRAALTRAPGHPCRAALLSHVTRLRREGIVIVESIAAWRKSLVPSDPEGMLLIASAAGTSSSAAMAAFAPYMWRGADYLAKMLHDADFVGELPGAVRV